MDRSRSRKKDKHKHKDKHKDKDKKEKNEKKEKKEKTKTKMKTKEFNAAADKSENWNTDKVEQGTKQQEIGKEIIEMIQKEREEDKRSYEEWMVRKGYSTTRVK